MKTRTSKALGAAAGIAAIAASLPLAITAYAEPPAEPFAGSMEEQMTPAQFKQVTGADSFPDYLRKDVRNGNLHVYSNGEFTYRLKDVHAHISVIWNFEAPAGAGDTHFSTMRGTKAALTIRQGEAEKYRPVLYIEKGSNVDASAHDAAVKEAIASLQQEYPGVAARRATAA